MLECQLVMFDGVNFYRLLWTKLKLKFHWNPPSLFLIKLAANNYLSLGKAIFCLKSLFNALNDLFKLTPER